MRAVSIGKGSVCAKFNNGDKEVSLAFDDSCGALPDMSRVGLRCFKGDVDMTKEVFDGKEEVYWASEADMVRAMAWLMEG